MSDTPPECALPAYAFAVVLPLPDPYLSTNRKTAPMAVAKARKAARQRAILGALQVLNGRPRPYWPRAEWGARFYFAHRRRHDEENLAATLKPYLDGLVDAGILIDDSMDHLRRAAGGIEWVAGPAPVVPRVLLWVRPVDAPPPALPPPALPWVGQLRLSTEPGSDWGWIVDEAGTLVFMVKAPPMSTAALEGHRRNRTDPTAERAAALLRACNGV